MERRSSRRREEEEQKRRERPRNLGAFFIIVAEILVLVICVIVQASVIHHKRAQSAADVQPQPAASDIVETETVAETVSPLSPMVFNPPAIVDDGSSTGTDSGTVYVWDKKAFELFWGSDSAAERYAQLMNHAVGELDGLNVYSMIVPNHTEMGLPDRLKNVDGGAQTSSQAEYIGSSYGMMDSGVTAVNAYNALSEHCNEYIYFNSDHHWSGLGAYYAYTAFAETVGRPVLDLGTCTENVIEGFTGTLTKLTSAPVDNDAVHYWTFPYDVTDDITEESGNTYSYDSCYYKAATGGDYTYGVFLMGDNPLETIRSSSDQARGKIAVIHESYGNAFIPYLTYNYSEVYSIDFRSFAGDVSDFCAENEITDVLFLNGVMSSATQVQLDSINAIL